MGRHITENPLSSLIREQGYAVLDGGLATELERRGANLDDPLWSAKLLREAPELIEKVSYDYLCAGADIVTTATYQATIPGLVAKGLTAAQAETLLKEGVRIAGRARDRFWTESNFAYGRLKPLVAASIGPYGAYLHDGSEYRGNYGFDKQQLKEFHLRRLEILLEAQPDVFAFETFPSLLEAEAIGELLSAYAGIEAWFSFSCRDESSISDGSNIRAAIAALDSCSQIAAIGVNCIAPPLVEPLLRLAASVTSKPLIVYPNSGAGYDAALKNWTNKDNCDMIVSSARHWFHLGARIVGGCCRTTPSTIKSIRASLATLSAPTSYRNIPRKQEE